MAEIVMNPVRQRNFQYFLLHETGGKESYIPGSGEWSREKHC